MSATAEGLTRQIREAPRGRGERTAEKTLLGKKFTESLAAQAGEAAAQGATPLAGNAYKVELVRVAVKRALVAAFGRP